MTDTNDRRRWVPYLGLATLATVVLLVAAVGGPASSQSTQDASAPPDSVTVQGSGVVTGRPDVLRVEYSVQETGETVDAALQDANAAMQRVQEVFLDGGVAEEDLQTSGLWINPRYGKGSTIVGYAVSEDLTVKIRELEVAGALISDAVTAGGDAARVNGIAFALEDNEALLDQARQQAVADARSSAETLASAADRGLGRAITITEDRSATPRPVPYAAALTAEDSASVPLQTGQSEVTVQVTVTWELD